MAEFRVVDLESQAREVAKHIRGWEKSAVLSWLQHFGEIQSGHPGNPDAYRFRSHAGVLTSFILGDAGQLTIILDHTTWIVPVDEDR